MKITAINGSMRHGSTWNSMNLIVEEIKKQKDVSLTEFFLPRDMPHFCNGCFSCFYNGEHTCPHAGAVTPIAEAVAGADLVILTSPVYGMDVSGQMKALLDHLCYQWMSHRPDPRMFDKIGLTVVTTAGAGLGHTSKTMANSLKFWGVQSLFSCRIPVSAMKWDDVSDKTKAKIQKRAAALAGRIVKAADRGSYARGPLFRSFFFKMMTGMQKKNDWNPTDRSHWESQGWLSGKNPFKEPAAGCS